MVYCTGKNVQKSQATKRPLEKGFLVEFAFMLRDHMPTYLQLLPEIHENAAQKTTQGPLYRVMVHNDHVTPMDFVLTILTSIFRLDPAHAFQVMYSAHVHGTAYVQTLPKSEAHKRIGMAHVSATLHHYPLHFTAEPEGPET